jgi:phosphoserine aminotransferase
MMMKPLKKPKNPCFSCGPCAKRPGWNFNNLDLSVLGRSHRSGIAKSKLKEIIDRTRQLLDIPADYKIGITPASDTGAVEIALWNLLGHPDIGVDVFAWERFSRLWLEDIMDELTITDRRAFEAVYGEIPDISQMQPDRDAVFAWNGTTGGVRVPNAEAIPAGFQGLRICDATSAIFAYDMPWEKLDVTTWSWQKTMGGEAQHGMIVMSPKALERLKNHRPSWPVPKIYKLHDDETDEVDWPFFEGVTINTPSMLCVVDALDSLQWIESIGGRAEIQRRVERNDQAMDNWVENSSWVDYLCKDKAIRSKTSICLTIKDPAFLALDKKAQQALVARIVQRMEEENAGYDIRSYKTAPLGFRFWIGSTVETEDIVLMTQWLDFVYTTEIAAIN